MEPGPESILFMLCWVALSIIFLRIHRVARTRRWGGIIPQDLMGPAREPRPQWPPPARADDPVCGLSVATEGAKTSVHAGTIHYFCSRECREIFEAAPTLYPARGKAGDQTARKSA